MTTLQTHRIPFTAMAGPCELVIDAADAATAQTLAQRAINEVRRIEHKYSRYREDSILARINAAAGGAPVACDDETWSLLEHADTLYRASGGLFDITSGVLRRAWDFKQARRPGEALLAEVLQHVGWTGVERGERCVRLARPGMEIDFGGFGKEYAADRAATLLAEAGVRHGYVNLAGDMRVIGPKPDGQPWSMGIQDPRRQGALVATLPVERGGLATSGDYERFFELDGQRYCHVLDPRNGQPVTHWRSVSVLAPLAVMAGSCTTIAMLKQQEAIGFLDATGLDYLAIDQQGLLHVRGQPPQAPPD